MTESARFIVCVPTYDERENLARMVDALAAVRERAPGASGDVLVIDDSSPDGTGELADELAQRVAGKALSFAPLIRAVERALA